MDALKIIKQMPSDFSLKMAAGQGNLIEKRKQKLIDKENNKVAQPVEKKYKLREGPKEKRRRNRKDPKQMEYLMSQYRLDPEWTKDTCKRVALETGLSESQVYKWGWDQRNKLALLAAQDTAQL